MIDFSYPKTQIDNLDIAALEKLCADLPEEAVIYEIGAWTGSSTCILGAHAKRVNGQLITIDTFKGQGSELERYAKIQDVRKILEENLKSSGVEEHVTIIQRASDEVISWVDDKYIDLIFIDGDHRYSQVSKDIAGWWPKVKDGGIMSGHDFEQRTYDEAYIEMDEYGPAHHGVVKAVTERFPDVNKDARVWWVKK